MSWIVTFAYLTCALVAFGCGTVQTPRQRVMHPDMICAPISVDGVAMLGCVDAHSSEFKNSTIAPYQPAEKDRT